MHLDKPTSDSIALSRMISGLFGGCEEEVTDVVVEEGLRGGWTRASAPCWSVRHPEGSQPTLPRTPRVTTTQ